MSYLKHFTVTAPPERGWDNRFTLGQIPEYNALNDRYCKFWKKRTKARNAGQGGWDGVGGPMGYGGVPLEGPMLAFQQPPSMSPDLATPPIQVPADMRHPHTDGVNRLSMTDPGGRGRFAATQPPQILSTMAHSDISPAHPPQILTAQDLRRPHRVVRTPKSQPPTPPQSVPPQQPILTSPANTEVQSMLERRNTSVQVEKAIEIREGFLYLLQELMERSQAQQIDKDALCKEVTNIVSSLRNATLDCVECISKWENLEDTQQPYLWKGVSYLSKLQTDLNIFAQSRLAGLLDFTVLGNPLLIRNDESRHATPGTLPPVKQGKDHSGISKKDPLGERLAMAQQYLRRYGCEDEIEEEGYLYDLEDDDREGDEEKEVPEEDWLARTEDRSKEHECTAAVQVQRVYRGFRDRKNAQNKSRQRTAAIVIQKLGRKINASTETDALRTKRRAAQRIQALQRGIRARDNVKRIRLERFCTTEIQRSYRGHLGRRVATAKAFERASCVQIQSAFRGYITRKYLTESRDEERYAAAAMIQKHWKGKLVRSDVRFDKDKLAAVEKLQSWNRGLIGRNVSTRMQRERRAAVAIQAWLRGNRARHVATERRSEKRAATTEEAVVVADKAATSIQSGWRMHAAKKQVQEDLEARRKEQETASEEAHFRGQEEGGQKQVAEEQHAAAVKIQAQQRKRVARREVEEKKVLHESAKTIQRLERGRQSRACVDAKRKQYEVALSVKQAELDSKLSEQVHVPEEAQSSPSPPQESEESKEEQPEEGFKCFDSPELEQASPAPVDPDRGHVSLLLKVALCTGVEGDGLQMLKEATQDLPVSPLHPRHIKVVSPAAPQQPTPKAAKVVTPEAAEAVTPKVEAPVIDVTPIQRGWRCVRARAAANKQKELKKYARKKNSCLAKQAEQEYAHAIIRRFGKSVEAKGHVKNKRYTVHLQELKNADLAITSEREYAARMVQSWVKDILGTKKKVAQRREQKRLDCLKHAELARQQEREVAVVMIQSLHRVRGAKKAASEKARLRSLERAMIDAQARDQEAEFLSRLERQEQQFEAQRDHMKQTEEHERDVLSYGARSETEQLMHDLLAEMKAEDAREKEEQAAAAKAKQAAELAEQAKATQDVVPPADEVQAPLRVETPKDEVRKGDEAEGEESPRGLDYLVKVSPNKGSYPSVALLQSTSPAAGSNVQSTVSSLSALNCLLIASELSTQTYPCLATLANIVSGSDTSSPAAQSYTAPFLGIGLEALLAASHDSLQNITFLAQCIDYESPDSNQGSPQGPDQPCADEAVPSPVMPPCLHEEQAEVAKTEPPTPADMKQAEPVAEAAAPEAPPSKDAVPDEAIVAVVKKVEEASNDKMLAMEKRLLQMQERLEQMERLEAKRLRGEEEREQRQKERSLEAEKLEQQRRQEEERERREEEERRSKQDEGERKMFADKMDKIKEADAKRQAAEDDKATSRVEAAQKFKDDKVLAHEQAKREAAVTIQCKYRQVAARNTYFDKKEQRIKDLEEEEEMDRTERKRLAAATIQRNWAQRCVRIRRSRMHAVVAIQAVFRGAHGRQMAKEKKVQKEKERTERARDDIASDEAAMQIQKSWRGKQGREQAAQVKMRWLETVEVPAAETIQRGVRVTQAKNEAEKRREKKAAQQSEVSLDKHRHDAACTIQRAWRCYNARFEASWRRDKKRNLHDDSRQQNGALVIQNQFRSHRARREVAARREQKAETQRQLVQNEREHELRERKKSNAEEAAQVQKEADAREINAALIIQRAYKCYNARFMLRWKRDERSAKRNNEMLADEQKLQDSASTTVQCMYRCHVAREVRRSKLEARDMDTRLKSQEEASIEAAATKIQCAYRCFNARFEAAWRRERKQKAVQADVARRQKEVQSHEIETAKLTAAQAKNKREEAAVITIQCAWRAYNAKFQRTWMTENKVRNEELRKRRMQEKDAASTIQRAERCRKARNERGRREEQRQTREADAIKHAKLVREAELANAATTIQCMTRSRNARLVAEAKGEERNKKLDALVYNERRHRAARTIQCMYRCRIAKFELEYRRMVESEEVEQERSTEMNKAAVKIQSKYRVHQAHNRTQVKREERKQQELNTAATRIQSQWKGKHDRDHVKQLREEKDRTQAEEEQRLEVAQNAIKAEESLAATRIQAQYRGRTAREEVKNRRISRLEEEKEELGQREKQQEEEVAATHIQARWRGHRAREEAEKKFEEKQAAVMEKENEAAEVIQKAERDRAAVRIQKQWKGSKARQDVAALKANTKEDFEDLSEDESFCREELAQDCFEEADHIYSALRQDLDDEGARTKAAVCIQSQFRGFQARNEVLELLYLEQQREALEEEEERDEHNDTQ